MTSPNGSLGASGSEERAVALDALRGIALFGVLLVNLITAFRVSLFEHYFLPGAASGSPWDRAVARVLEVGIEHKAFILFSLLFGVGLAVQHERTRARGIAFTPYVARRLAMLLGIGVTHLVLIWNGDILTLYAVVGVLAAPLLRLPVRALLPIGLLLVVLQVMPLGLPTPFASQAAMQEHIDAARLAYGFGSFGDVLSFRVHELRPIAALLLWSVPRTLGLFLLGACAWRSGIFRGERRALVRMLALIGIVAGGAAVWAASSGVDLGRWREVVGSWGAILLAFGYAATVLVAFERPRAARVLSVLAPLGRMALTSYLTQSIVLGFIFYGYGLGLFGRLGEARAAAIGIALYIAQAVLSALFLRRCRFGPVEWLWRSFTYGAWQPMRR